jgi:hypothetical protein
MDELRHLIISKDGGQYVGYFCEEPVLLHTDDYAGGFAPKIHKALVFTDKKAAMKKCRWISKIYADLDTTFSVRTMSAKDLFKAKLK